MSSGSASLAVGVVALMAAAVVASSVSSPSPASASASSSGVEPSPSGVVAPAVAPFVPPAPSVAAARSPAAADDEPDERPLVAVVGDSLAYSVATDLDRRLRAAGTVPVLDVAPGRRIPVRGLDGQISAGLEVARDLRTVAPAAWVVQLGTNDVAYEPADAGRYAASIVAMLDAIGPDVPVVWVNVHRADRPAEAEAFDAALALLDAERPQLHVADWATVARSEPVLADDGVHLGPGGGDRFAAIIAEALTAALG